MANNIIDSIQLSGITYQIQGSGGGGKAIEAGRGIAITTGETADTVSFNLPISAGTGVNSLIIAGARTATGLKSIAIGNNSAAKGMQSIAINQSTANGQDSFSQGTSYAQKTRSSAFGQQNYSNNDAELSCGQFNNSVSASTTFGNSGNTLFSVGNGTSTSARHNAFEIRQNGDIYLSSGGTDIKLQDHLGGGGSVTVDTELDSGSTNPVANSAITTALDEKVNVADNIVSAATITFAYNAGDTSYKYPYDNGLIINEFYVKPVNQYAYTNIAAWNYIYISNGSSYTEIKVNVDCGNYQITAVTSTSGENFTYAIEDGVLHVTLSDGYFIQTISQNQDFQISYEKYTIESGQTADVINDDLIDVIQDIYDQVPKSYLTAVTPMLDSTRLIIQNTKSDGSISGKFISFGSSIKGDNNKMDVYLPSRYLTDVTLNTGKGNYCQVPSLTFNDYSSAFAYMDLAVNTGYTGSSTSFTFTVKTLFKNNTVQTDTFTYDVANKTIGGNQLYISVYCYNNTISIYPVQYNFSRIQSVSEPNCRIGGVDSPTYFKNQYIITGVTAASYGKQANTVINEIYSELNGKATTTYVNQSTSGKAETTAVTEAISEATSGKVDTSVYTAYTAATDTALAGKQTTLTAGTGISIIDNVISATGGGGGGGKAIEAGRGITITTGATADTVSFNLPISAGTGSNSIVIGNNNNVATGASSVAIGSNNEAYGNNSIAVGSNNTASSSNSTAFGSGNKAQTENSFAIGYHSEAKDDDSFAAGQYAEANGFVSMSLGRETITNNMAEFACGQDNVSNKASNTYGDSGNTLFSVGNGEYGGTRHNAFEIRQNGDIYLTLDGQDVKLQDQLGGGGITSGEVQTMIDESVSGKANSSDSTYSVNANIENEGIYFSTLNKDGAQIDYSFEPQIRFQAPLYSDFNDAKVKISGVTAVTSASTDSEIPTAKAVNDKLGGLSLVKLTQAQYDALATKDNSTLYIIVD